MLSGHSRSTVAEERRAPSARRDLYPWLVALLLASVYVFAFSGQFHSADEESVLSMAESLVKRAWFDTPQRAFAMQIGLPITQETLGVDGHLYSKRGWVWPVLVAPFYALSLLSSRLGGLQTAHLASPVVTALTGSLVYVCGRELGFGRRTSASGALAFGLCSIALVYAKFLFSESLIGLALLAVIWMLLRYRRSGSAGSAALAGLFFGLAGATRLSTLALAPVVGLYVLWGSWSHCGRNLSPNRWRRIGRGAVAFALGVLPPVALSGAHNWLRFGSPWQGGYTSAAEGFTNPLLAGLYGLLLSPGKGFFWYSPILLLAFPGTVKMWRVRRADVLLLWGLFVGSAVTYALWYMWWGGSVWGPRFLVPLCAPLTLLVLPVLEWAHEHRVRRVGVTTVALLSVGVQLLGTSVSYLDYGASLVELDPRAEWTLAIHDLRYQPILGHIRYLKPEHLDLAWVYSVDGRFTVDGWMMSAGLLSLVVCAASLVAFVRRGRLPGGVLVPGVVCIVAVTLSQVRLYHGLYASQAARAWRSLYGQVAEEARRGDALFVQDGFGAELSYSLDRSRVRRYHWSPRPSPLDDLSAHWIERFAEPRVWLASGVPAFADNSRGIERWLADQGARLVDIGFGQGPRLTCYERTPLTLNETSVDLVFGDVIRLLRYASPDQHLSPGESLHLVLVWRAEKAVPLDFSVFVHLVGPDQEIYRQIDGSPVSGFRPTTGWQIGEEVVDRYGFMLPEDCPVGDYRLLVGVYRWDTLERLPIQDSDGRQFGDTFDIGAFTVG